MPDFSWIMFGSIFVLILAVTLTLMWVMPKIKANRDQAQKHNRGGGSADTTNPGGPSTLG